jgi:hypothetical protein
MGIQVRQDTVSNNDEYLSRQFLYVLRLQRRRTAYSCTVLYKLYHTFHKTKNCSVASLILSSVSLQTKQIIFFPFFQPSVGSEMKPSASDWRYDNVLLAQSYHTPHGAVKDEYGEIVERSWRGKTEQQGQNLSQCHFVHHKSRTDPGANPVTLTSDHKYTYMVGL